MALEDYRSDTMLSINILPELYCSFTIYKINPDITPPGFIHLYVTIEHDIIFNHIDYQYTIELRYTEEEYATVLREEALIENIKMYYLYSESMRRGLDEYFH